MINLIYNIIHNNRKTIKLNVFLKIYQTPAMKSIDDHAPIINRFMAGL